MPNYRLASLLVFLYAFICAIQPIRAQADFCVYHEKLVKLLYNVHYAPTPAEQIKKESIINGWLASFDPDKEFFSNSIKNEINAYPINFLDSNTCNIDELIGIASNSYLEQLKNKLKYIRAIDSQSIKYDSALTYNTKAPNSEEEFLSKWGSLLQFQTIQNFYYNVDSAQLNLKNFQDSFLVYNQKVIEAQLCELQRELNDSVEVLNQFGYELLSQVANQFDPHSMVMSPKQMGLLEKRLSGDEKGFGIGLEEVQQGTFEVSNVLPGSSAWNTNSIHEGDIIIEILINSKRKLNLDCITMDELSVELRSKGCRSIFLKLRKENGKQIELTLMKAEMESLGEGMVAGYTLKGNHKIGYISIPAFYADNSPNGDQGMANDLSKEIYKLKRDSIEGLIIDVRYNGGGELGEAIDLAGLFIDVGPIASLKYGDEDVKVLKDRNRGVAYDGPMVYLINGFSASASELVASVLQDHQRAVILGSRSYGKATGQSVIPLISEDRQINKNFAFPFLKVTTFQMFRSDGKSYQAQGIYPDIKLPEEYEIFIEYESDESNAIHAEAIDKKLSMPDIRGIPYKYLKDQSTLRTDTSKYFKSLRVLSEQTPNLEELENVSLNFNQYLKKIEVMENTMDSYEQLNEFSRTNFEIKRASGKHSSYFVRPVAKIEVEQNIERISKDKYIEEAYFILKDLINFKY